MDWLLRRLPVVIVDDWNDITLPLLQQAYTATQGQASETSGERILEGRFVQPELFAAWWGERFRSYKA